MQPSPGTARVLRVASLWAKTDPAPERRSTFHIKPALGHSARTQLVWPILFDGFLKIAAGLISEQ